MQQWRIKAALMRVFSRLPWGNDFHYFAQRRITRSLPSSDEKFVEIFEDARNHLGALRRHSASRPESACFYEFGAGWELGIPLSFHALGIRTQVLVDIRRLLRVELVNAALKKLERISRETQSARSNGRFLEVDHSDQWLKQLQQWYGIRYLAPCDARNTGLENESIDFVTSTNTLEHIPAADIRMILRENRRLLKQGGLMSFIIDYQDHYSYSDRRITAFNFLKYSASTWRSYNPAFHYQNRLRHKDYLCLFKEEGFEVIEESVKQPSENDLLCLQQMSLSQEFKENYSIPELGIRSAQVVVRPIL